MLQTEFEFELPCGYVDERGTLLRHGAMRLSTALDEVEAIQDVRVRENEAYLSILLLSRVVSRLGDLPAVTPAVIERLFSPDFVYLQDLYVRVNEIGAGGIETECPACGTRFGVDLRDPAAT